MSRVLRMLGTILAMIAAVPALGGELSSNAATSTTNAARAVETVAAEVAASLEEKDAGALADLAARYRAEQTHYLWLSPPQAEFVVRQDGDLMVFDPKAFPEDFTKQLIGEIKYGCPVYTLIIAEDPVTRETVFANADGKEIAALKPEVGYNPYWLLEWYYPDIFSGYYTSQEINALQADFDPSRVQITVSLLPSEYVQKYAAALAEESLKRAALKPPGGGGPAMMGYQGPPVEDLVLAGCVRGTNGILLTLAYPADFTNRIDIFTCSDLVSAWWDLALDSTNINTSTNWIEWVDTSAIAETRLFYAAGDADLDSDSDGFADAREKFMYHTSATNADTDLDGLGDWEEIIALNTDPNNAKTNKPIVWISYPANESRKVWLP